MIVHLGDGNDLAESNNDHAAGHSVQFYGEDGDDDLQSQGSADLLDGGPGNDRLEPDDDDAGSGDIVVGGPGTDSLWLDTAFGGNGPISASFDGVANDGFAGEADNYGADLENLEGVSTAPSINFVGNDAPNKVQMRSESADVLVGLGGDDFIDGANGNDVIDGGDGNDTIYGGGNDDQIKGGPGLDSLSGEGSGSGFFISVPGNDTIDARDGVREQLNCGPGADTAIVDELDVVPQDPGSLCEAVDRSAAAAPAAPGRAEHPLVEAAGEQGPRQRLAVVQGRVQRQAHAQDDLEGDRRLGFLLDRGGQVRHGAPEAVLEGAQPDAQGDEGAREAHGLAEVRQGREQDVDAARLGDFDGDQVGHAVTDFELGLGEDRVLLQVLEVAGGLVGVVVAEVDLAVVGRGVGGGVVGGVVVGPVALVGVDEAVVVSVVVGGVVGGDAAGVDRRSP